MLLCSGLSSFSLVAAKLTASLLNALLLMALQSPFSVWCFSLEAFLSTIPAWAHDLFRYRACHWLIWATLLNHFSAPRDLDSNYVYATVVWIFLPLITLSIISATSDFGTSSSQISTFPDGCNFGTDNRNGESEWYSLAGQMLLAWNPVIALFNTYGPGIVLPPYTLRI